MLAPGGRGAALTHFQLWGSVLKPSQKGEKCHPTARKTANGRTLTGHRALKAARTDRLSASPADRRHRRCVPAMPPMCHLWRRASARSLFLDYAGSAMPAPVVLMAKMTVRMAATYAIYATFVLPPDHVVLNATIGWKWTYGRVERLRDGLAIRPTVKSRATPPTFNCGHPPDPCREIVTEMAQNFVKTCQLVPLFSTP